MNCSKSISSESKRHWKAKAKVAEIATPEAGAEANASELGGEIDHPDAWLTPLR